ncbi:c6 zinc finger domain protein [Colletotrichum incanum]|uniref:C6 zinc finger domain protein n=1 Tax=Colletotrichum incanum TaxID=1573173 RepID=A0A162N3W3_COLIC|nr:c6 zinc finger domain protein [Colletotrichum incanum]OHW97946.1 GAL4 domain-containing protein [Colletotrichum incanum]
MGCRPSASCFACKARKVKCDLRKPSCNRCVGLGRSCPGYADPWAIMHRQQNAAAAHQVELRVAKRLKERENSKASATTACSNSGSSPGSVEETEIVRRVPTMPKPLQIDSEVVSLTQFYSNYASAGQVALFSLLPSLKSSGSTSAVFEEALKATALASSSVQMRQTGLMVQARQRYGSAITKISAALQNPATAQDDSVVVALLTLGIYEALVPDTTPRKITSHCRGSLVLLRYRAEQGVASSLDSGMLAFLVHLGVLETFIGMDGRSSVLAVLKSAPWAGRGLVEPLLVRAISFKAKIHSVMSSTNIRETSITEILQTGLGIIRDLEAAANYRIMSPGPRKTPGRGGTEEEDLNNFNNLLGRNSTASEAIIRGLYLTVRLHIIEYILSLSIALGEPTRDELSMLASLPHGLTALEQICEQIRIVFGFDGREPAARDHGIGFNAWCMFWPMIAVLKSGFTDRDTKLWIMNKCSLVSQASGFGMAMYQMGWFEQGSVEMGTVG